MAGLDLYRQLKLTCDAVHKGSDGLLLWAWDDYLGAALAVFSSSDSATVEAVLARTLPSTFDAKTVAKAAPPVTKLVETLGGLRVGQRLFVSEPDHGALLYGAWWPWGDAKKVSLRIGALLGAGSDADNQALGKALRTWFGL